MFSHKQQCFSKDISINDITNLTSKEKKNLFTNVKFRKFLKTKFFSKEIIENSESNMNQFAEMVFLYCSYNPYSHNLKNIDVLQLLLKNNHCFYFSKEFYIDLIPEKLLISYKSLSTLIKDFPSLKEEIFLHSLRFYLEFLVDEKNWILNLFHIWNNYFAIDKKFPINNLFNSINFQRIVYINESKTKDFSKEILHNEVTKFEKKRVIYLILVLSRKSRLNFENKLIFEFLFGKSKLF